ncbi:ribonuclease HI family protein [Hippea sp. KM1]|uniref:ribonuclease HI family protein n=1 Tax=Hippea sp. KM1 TaxID=944481 RepID=UPI00046D502B|nr:ribonuclease HI family protein [Hippea sp. KM1]
MNALEFFLELRKRGSIEEVKKHHPSLTNADIDSFFDEIIGNLKDDDCYEMFVDGASSSNPGKAGIGIVIKKNGVVVDEVSRYIGKATNNVAEYTALLEGLKRLVELGVKRVRVFSDSELVVKQLKGLYRVKDSGLKPLYEDVLRLTKGFDLFEIEHITRDKNKQADRLAKSAIPRG